MALSTFPTLVVFILWLSLVAAQGTTNPQSATATLSFYTNNHDPVPGSSATALVSQNKCITIPTLTNGFESSLNQSIFAVYQDTNCQSYLYSVTGLLANTHGAGSLMWTENDLSGAHPIGETYTNPQLSTGQTEEQRRRTRLIQVAIVSVAAAAFFILLGLYMWYLDNKKNKARGGVVPEPYSPTTGRGMAESSANNQNTKSSLFGFHRKNESAASSISYLPPYGEDSAAKATPRPSEQHPQPRQHPNAVNSTHEGVMAKSGSFSLLSYKVGTGAGLDPETVPQGRNAGFGLGYDLEDNKKRDTRRDSDILMRDAMMTPPHSPNMRPLSMMSDDGGYLGRHSLSVSADSTIVQMHA